MQTLFRLLASRAGQVALTGGTMTDKSHSFVLFNAVICTMNSAQPWAEALAVCDGRIVAVGSRAEVEAAADVSAERIDALGRMVMPGMADVHNHFVFAGRAELYEVNFPPYCRLDQIIERVREAARQRPAERWIIGGIWGSTLLGELTYEARLRLDEAAAGRPVMLRDDSHHNRWLNAAALQACGIDADTPDPVNGTIVRHADSGEATGLLLEAASALVESVVNAAIMAEPEANIAAARHALQRLNAYGITCLQEPLSTRMVLDTLKTVAEREQLSAWVVASMPVVQGPFASDQWGAELFALRDSYRSRYFRPDFGKLFMDGVPTTHTAAMLDPYLPTDTYGCCFRGSNFMTVPQLARVIADCEQAGISLKIHCTGDGSVRATLDAIDVVRSFNGGQHRHQIAHAGYVHADDIPRFRELGVVADLSPMLWFPGVIVEQLKTVLAEEQVNRSYPHRTMAEAGVLLAAGSDWPVLPDPSPWIGLQGMITRQDPTGQFPGALAEEERLDLATALRAYTLGPAEAMGLAQETGSLEVGKSADLIVLDRNLFTTPVNELVHTRVLTTYFAGQVVFEAEV
ncbi:amidohydrolase [Pokkaliibacter sp. MBI-7]|uniref:amidohydrolase n=1 Tax=Pokkaliibacter sp. MBI-7 TaxID=3040600 RepID=UPI00244901E2|nr:amidohydrolase [Pokkaliibacter sp. MBI-7]MDH2434345.1 amidohydrolase [Pokkaliibacter sp. MBI-7]